MNALKLISAGQIRKLSMKLRHGRSETEGTAVSSRLFSVAGWFAKLRSVNRVAYVRFEGPPYPLASAAAQRFGVGKAIVRKLESHVSYRRNARSWQYMESLARENDSAFDSAKVYSGENLSTLDWKALDRVILLWPDASGMGWSPVEREVFRRMDPNTTLMVFNGRRRSFSLTKKQWTTWRFRRFVDKWFIGDTAALAFLLITTPFLVLADKIRGKA